jgi:uncharacterized protein YycO
MSPITAKPGDLLFVWGNGWIPDAIEFVTKGPSHVALFVDSDTVAESQGGRDIGEQSLSYYTSGDVERLEIWRDETLTDDERAEMVRYAKSMYGQPYDYALIPLEFAHFVAGVNIDWYHETNGHICSTYVCEVAEHVGHRWAYSKNPAPVDAQTRALTKLYVWEDGKWWSTGITENG